MVYNNKEMKSGLSEIWHVNVSHNTPFHVTQFGSNKAHLGNARNGGIFISKSWEVDVV